MIDYRAQNDAGDFPASEKAVRSHPEVWAPRLLLELVTVGRDHLGKAATEWAGWALADFNPEALLGAGSWNWQQMIGACVLWLDVRRPVVSSYFSGTIAEWWIYLLAAQANLRDMSVLPNRIVLALDGGAPDILLRYGGTEPLSCDYEGYRQGSALAVRYLALKFRRNSMSPPLLAATAAYHRAFAALYALGAGPVPDAQEHTNAHGQYWYSGPTVSPVGERSPSPHWFQNDLGELLTAYNTGEHIESKHADWPAWIARMLLAEFPGGLNGGLILHPGAAVEALAGVRLAVRFAWALWQHEGTLVVKGPRINGNTVDLPASWNDLKGRMVCLSPYSPQQTRHPGPPAQLAIHEGATSAMLTVTDGGDPQSQEIPQRSPDSLVVGDEAGVRLIEKPTLGGILG